jgi:hypothetical protein
VSLISRFRRPITPEPTPREWLGLVPADAPLPGYFGATDEDEQAALDEPAPVPPPLILATRRPRLEIEASPIPVTLLPYYDRGRYSAHRELDLGADAVDDTHAHIFNSLRREPTWRELVRGDA